MHNFCRPKQQIPKPSPTTGKVPRLRRSPRIGWVVGLLAVAGAMGCTSAGKPFALGRPIQAVQAPVSSDTVRLSLQKAVDAGSQPDGSRRELITECRRGELFRRVTVGGRVGVWNWSRYFSAGSDDWRWIAQRLAEARFDRMPDQFGGKGSTNDAATGTSDQARRTGAVQELAAPPMVVCRVLWIDGSVRKEVVQLSEGAESKELLSLAEDLLGRFEHRGQEGRAIASLQEGLELVRSGVLPVELVRLDVQRKPVPRPNTVLYGFHSSLKYGEFSSRGFATDRGYRSIRTLGFEVDSLLDLVDQLIATDLEGLPAKLYSLHTTDLRVSVLDQKFNRQARTYQGVLPSSHGGAQARFNLLVNSLLELHRRALREGSSQEG